MYRFQITPQRKSGKKLWFSLFLFILLILLFSLGTSSLSENTVCRQCIFNVATGYHFTGPIALRRRLSSVLPFFLL